MKKSMREQTKKQEPELFRIFTKHLIIFLQYDIKIAVRRVLCRKKGL